MSPRRLDLAIALILASACATTPSAPPSLALLGADHFAGTIRSGALAQAVSSDLGEPAWFEVRVAYVGAAPIPPGDPVSSRASQVFVETGSEPFRSKSVLALGIVLVASEPAQAPRSPVAGELRRAEPAWPGTTTTWRITVASDAQDPPRAPWSSFELDLSPGPDPKGEPEVALVFESEDVAREHLVLEPSVDLGGSAPSVFLPAPRRRAPNGGFLLQLRRVDASVLESPADSIASAQAALASSTARARAGTGALSREEGFQFESKSAWKALEDRALRRSALVFLAQSTGAAITGDLAIGAEPAALEAYLVALRERVRGVEPDTQKADALSWILESASYTWLAARAADEKHPLEPELRALLLVHAGELARFPDLVREAVEESDGLAAFELRLRSENRIFLEDADPSARLRAFEWLRERGVAPAGYDPLAALADRRAALDRAREQETAGKGADSR